MSLTFPNTGLSARAGVKTLFLLLIFSAFSGVASAQVFSNTSAITINDNSPATPYPSAISVSGVGTVYKVSVTLNGLSHTFPNDISMMLVAPNGTRFVFMSRPCGDPNLTNVDITFDDAATATLPDAGPCAGGTYRPSVAGTSTFPAPAPQPTNLDYAGAGGATFANKFNGINPNGTWNLYISDNAAADTGSISGGWALTVTPSVVTSAPANLSGRVTDANGRGISNVRITIADTVSGESRFITTNPFGFYNLSDLETGAAYILTAEHKRYTFQNNPRVVQLFDDQNVEFIAEP